MVLPLPTRREVAWAALATALTAAYSSAFTPWRWLSEQLSPPALEMLPPALALLLFAIVIIHAAPRLRVSGGTTIAWLVTAATLALAGLLFADSAFPAKRVHVFQYALLALVVRRGLANRLDGVLLVAMSALVAALLGVHDELIQGLRPERYFGLTDILVNTVSAFAGGCLGAALSGPGNSNNPPSPRAWLAVGLALAGLAVLLSGLTYAPAATLPVWAWLPALLCLASWPLLVPAGRRWPGALPVWLACGALVEPAIANLADLPFA
ncbi:MAG TPA: VanZ family protein [Alphaproteobacteria bacterium]|jgi:hypothetical protein|nr:VanZ family protein [Alphaproteobacteria bacterium]|tara:strand:- start:1433 stop:2233 length:801 start_codon:yes stop_codon:yes gene_type:complete